MKTKLILIMLFLLIACKQKESSNDLKVDIRPEAKIEPETKPIPKITSNIDLIFDAVVEYRISGFFVKGTTNLPEGTKLSINIKNRTKTFAQGDALIKNGEFTSQFGVDIFGVDNIIITCYKNKFWQSDDIINQLNFIITDWDEDNFNIEIDMKQQNMERCRKLINAPVNYKPIGKPEKNITDVSFGSVKRLSLNINYYKEIEDSTIDKEIRYFLYKTWTDNMDAKAIMVKCFYKKEKMSFMTGVFAPNGNWQEASANTPLIYNKVSIFN